MYYPIYSYSNNSQMIHYWQQEHTPASRQYGTSMDLFDHPFRPLMAQYST
jgi:hypothetical protein